MTNCKCCGDQCGHPDWCNKCIDHVKPYLVGIIYLYEKERTMHDTLVKAIIRETIMKKDQDNEND